MRNFALASAAFAVGCFSVASNGAELGDLLRSTLDHPAVDARREETHAARQALSAASYRYAGAGGLNAGIDRYEDQRFIGVLSPATLAAPPFDRTSTRYGIRYSVPVDLFGVIRASREAAQSSLEAAQLFERQQTLLKLHDAASAYVTLHALGRQQAALAAQRERVTATLDRVREEVKVQLAAGVDMKLAESEYARIASDEVRLKGSVEEARASLNEATGHTMTTAASNVSTPTWPSSLDSDAALPLRLARAEATAARAHAKEARRALYPALAAVGDYTSFEGTPGAPEAWSVGAMVTIPIDPTATRNARALDARARAAARREAAAAGELLRQWSVLKAAYESAVADIAALETEVSARREVVGVQAELQRVGLTSMEDLLRQQRDLVDAESRQAHAHASAVVTWSAAQVLLGTEPSAYISQLEQPE